MLGSVDFCGRLDVHAVAALFAMFRQPPGSSGGVVFRTFHRKASGVLRAAPACVLLLQPMEIFVDDEAKLTLHGLVQHYIMLQVRFHSLGCSVVVAV